MGHSNIFHLQLFVYLFFCFLFFFPKFLLIFHDKIKYFVCHPSILSKGNSGVLDHELLDYRASEDFSWPLLHVQANEISYPEPLPPQVNGLLHKLKTIINKLVCVYY